MLKKKIANNEVKKINPRDYVKHIEDSVSDLGIKLFEPLEGNININEDFLSLPPEITDVPSKDLGEYLNAFTQQKAFYRTVMGRVELCLEEARREYYEVSKAKYKSLVNSKLSETAKERVLNSDEEIAPSYHKYKDEQHRLSLIEYTINNIDDIIFMLSREVSRRTGDFSQENRNHNIGKSRR